MRSYLFVPGDAERKLARSLGSGADAIVIDLEDSVAPDAKMRAREAAAAFLWEIRKLEQRPRFYARINSLDTELWEGDLLAVMESRPDGIMLPKPRSGDDVRQLARVLDRLETENGAAAGSTRVIAIATEVPISILTMQTYLGTSERLEGLAWGAEDLSAALGATATRDSAGQLSSPFRLARDLSLITAAAAGVAAIDTVFLDLDDQDGLARESADAARDGFAGKLAIHPGQVPVINAAFTPKPEDIERARHVVSIFAEAGAAGVVSFKGQMLDRPHLVRAERVLERARLAGLPRA